MKAIAILLLVTSALVAQDLKDVEYTTDRKKVYWFKPPRSTCPFDISRAYHKMYKNVLKDAVADVKTLLNDDKVLRRVIWIKIARKYEVPKRFHRDLRSRVARQVFIELRAKERVTID